MNKLHITFEVIKSKVLGLSASLLIHDKENNVI